MNDKNERYEQYEQTFSLLDIFSVIAKHWRLVFFSVLLTAVLIVGYMEYTANAPIDAPYNELPDEYNATVKVKIDPGSGGTAASVLAQSGLAAIAGSRGTVGENITLAQTILMGPTLSQQIARDVNKEKDMDPPLSGGDVKRGLSSLYDPAKPILLSVIFRHHDRDFAKYIADKAVEHLEMRFKELSSSRLTYKKQFIEERLEQVQDQLEEAEEKMLRFQQEEGIIEIDTDVTDTGMFYVKDIVFSTYIPREERQEITTQYLNMERDLVVLEQMYSTLMKQYEVAKIEEMDESKTFQIIEPAVISFAGPFRAKIIVLFCAVTFVLAVLAAFVLDYYDRIKKDPEESKKLESIKQDFFGKKKTSGT